MARQKRNCGNYNYGLGGHSRNRDWYGTSDDYDVMTTVENANNGSTSDVNADIVNLKSEILEKQSNILDRIDKAEANLKEMEDTIKDQEEKIKNANKLISKQTINYNNAVYTGIALMYGML